MLDPSLEGYRSTCNALYAVMKKIKDAKAISTTNDDLVTEGMFLFSELRKYNCKGQTQCKRVRDNTQKVKKKLDSMDLILKNLQFEEIYLQREINKCHNYKSVDDELQLIPQSEFLSTLSAEEREKGEHEQMVKRLEWELEQRKLMKAELEAAELSKSVLEEGIREDEEYLTTLPPQLDKLLTSTTQVQDTLGLKIVHKQQQAVMAGYLPPQLYNLYSQVSGYSEFTKCGAVVTINGSVERAINLEPDNKNPDLEPDEDLTKSKRRSGVAEPSGKKRLFRAHPLTVEVIVPCDEGVHAKVQFTYLTMLEVVCVGISLMITTASPWRDKFSVGTDYMSSKELLCALWPADYGEDCPNPDTATLLNKFGLPSKSKIPSTLGRPFLWAQRLGGIVSWTEGAQLDVATSSETVAPFLLAIKHRCLARLALKYQLRILKLGKTVKEGVIPQPTILTEISTFKEVTQESLKERPFLTAALDQITEKDNVYECVVKRANVQCTAVITLSLEYPAVPPMILLELTAEDKVQTSANNPNIHTIEEELNIYIDEYIDQGREYLLTKLANKLCMCIDVYVEGTGLGPQIKFFMNKHKGRSMILPYVYNKDKHYFVHR